MKKISKQMEEKQIIKRSGKKQNIEISKIQTRLENLKKGITETDKIAELNIPIINIVTNVVNQIGHATTTSDLDILAAELAYKQYLKDWQYDVFAARIYISNLLKNIYCVIRNSYKEDVNKIKNNIVYYISQMLWNNVTDVGKKSALLHPTIYSAFTKYADRFQKIIKPVRNYNKRYRSINKLVDGHYLQKVGIFNNKGGVDRVVIETPQFMYLRVAASVVLNKPAHKKEFTHSREMLRKFYIEASGSDKGFDKLYEAVKYDYLAFGAESPKYEQYDITISDAQFAEIKEFYDYISTGAATFATPTMLNAGTRNRQYASCFLIEPKEDSLHGMMKINETIAFTSKGGGGNAIHGDIYRSAGSYIADTNGITSGPTSLMEVHDNTMKLVDQGGGKRKGVVAVYTSLWNINTISQLKLREAVSDNSSSGHMVFYGLWISDHFFRTLITKRDWYLFDPMIAGHLRELYDHKFSHEMPQKKFTTEEEINKYWNPQDFAFTNAYEKLVLAGKWKEKIAATQLYITHILPRLRDSGIPYCLSKDNVNSMNMQCGMIHGSNLCCEIVLHTNPQEFAVCTLSSIVVSNFVTDTPTPHKFVKTLIHKSGKKIEIIKYYDFAALQKVTRKFVRGLNKVIDINMYPVLEMQNSSFKRRPIGIGIQGLADALIHLGLPFGSEESIKFTREVQENMYYAALWESSILAKECGPYPTYNKSPASRGILHQDMYAARTGITVPTTCDWGALRKQIKKYGLRNSTVCANMPTQSTSNILGNSQSFETYHSIISRWVVDVKEYIVLIDQFIDDLKLCGGEWNDELIEKIVINRGIRGIDLFNNGKPTAETPALKKLWDLYITTKELSMITVVNMAAARQPFCDQSQSMNVHYNIVGYKNSIKTLLLGWKMGLKCLSYYTKSEGTREQIIGKRNNICYNKENCESCSA